MIKSHDCCIIFMRVINFSSLCLAPTMYLQLVCVADHVACVHNMVQILLYIEHTVNISI